MTGFSLPYMAPSAFPRTTSWGRSLAAWAVPGSASRADVCCITARGRGLASRLMQQLEVHALASGISLLVLDTLAGSDAEQFYQQRGWHRAGQIPDYAAAPDGSLHPTVYFYKHI